MRKFLLFLLLGLFVASCDDDDAGPTATVNLNFKATFDGEPLVFTLENYTYPDGRLIKFTRLNFFVSNVALLKETGGEAEVLDIDFVDFSDNSTLAEAETPITLSSDKVPAGTYKGIRIGIGVPASMNNSSAKTRPAGHPLRDNYNSEFWSDWDSFIFLKSEGNYDANGSGIDGNGDNGFGHHPGTDELYLSLVFNESIVLEEGKAFDFNFQLDALKLYVKDGIPLDLNVEDNLDTQSPSDLALAKFIMDNFVNAFVLVK
jgi:hypothetical protein